MPSCNVILFPLPTCLYLLEPIPMSPCLSFEPIPSHLLRYRKMYLPVCFIFFSGSLSWIIPSAAGNLNPILWVQESFRAQGFLSHRGLGFGFQPPSWTSPRECRGPNFTYHCCSFLKDDWEPKGPGVTAYLSSAQPQASYLDTKMNALRREFGEIFTPVMTPVHCTESASRGEIPRVQEMHKMPLCLNYAFPRGWTNVSAHLCFISPFKRADCSRYTAASPTTPCVKTWFGLNLSFSLKTFYMGSKDGGELSINSVESTLSRPEHLLGHCKSQLPCKLSLRNSAGWATRRASPAFGSRGG